MDTRLRFDSGLRAAGSGRLGHLSSRRAPRIRDVPSVAGAEQPRHQISGIDFIFTLFESRLRA